jgi:hypothetical protein
LDKFPVRTEYISKYSINAIKWSLLFSAINLILALLVPMFLNIELYSCDFLLYIRYIAVYLLITFPSFCFILFIHNYIVKRNCFYIDNNFLLITSPHRTKVWIDKLKKVEITKDFETGKCIILKIYSSQKLIFGAVVIGNEMFELDKIIKALRKSNTIPKDIWTEKTIRAE